MLYKPILELEHICVVTFTYLTTASENCADSTSRNAIDPPVVLQAWAPADLMQTRSSHGQQMIQTHSCDWNPLCPEINTHTHPFNGPLSGTTRVSRYQKGKTNLDFTEARNSEWQWHQLGFTQVCISLQTDNHASSSPLSFFTGRMPFLLPNQQRLSTEGKLTDVKLNSETMH